MWPFNTRKVISDIRKEVTEEKEKPTLEYTITYSGDSSEKIIGKTSTIDKYYEGSVFLIIEGGPVGVMIPVYRIEKISIRVMDQDTNTET